MKQWIIGRAPDCDIVLNEAAVSPRHCCLWETAEGYFLEDLDSTQGTFVNGRRVKGKQKVTTADYINLGPKVTMPWPGVAATLKETLLRTITIGRADDNDVVLNHAIVSARHARITIDGVKLYIDDLDSTNGVAIGHPNKKVKQAELPADAILFFGSLRMPLKRLLELAATEALKPKTAIVFQGKEMILGRSPSCDIVLNFPMVSARHARLTRANNQMLLADLRSSNGTYVNHQRIKGSVRIQPGDVIGLGTFTLTVQDGGVLKQRDFRGDVSLEARELCVDAPGKRLIEGCSFTIYPSELVGLMGPSGAGKTTLLRALNGYTPPTAGKVFLNGQDLYRHFDEYRLSLGYVPQDDIIHQNLTVSQALFYSARLRLPPDFSNADIRQRLRSVLRELHLEGTENVLIGSPEKKGISGGQRKRVNLAMELLTDPLVLFLDEPTSGLSSEDALVVIKVLRELADQGKTIFITIHQPSLEIYKLLDNLVMVGKDTNSPEPGQLLYYGPAYPDAIRFFQATQNSDPSASLSPDDLFRGMSKRPAAEWLSAYRKSKWYQEYVTQRAEKPVEASRQEAHKDRRHAPFLEQWKTLAARCWAIKMRDQMNTAILLAQAPIVAILLVLVFGKQISEPVTDENWSSIASGVGTIMFLMSLAALWFGASNAVREIVGEWAIYRRERMVNLRIASYVASKFTVLGALSVLQCAILLLIAGWGCDLQAPWLILYLLLLLSALVGVAIGLLLSAVARSSEVAIGLLPIVLLAMVILSGAMQPIHRMHSATQWVCLLNPARWAFESMIVSEAEHRPEFTPPIPGPAAPSSTAEPRDMAEHYFPRADSRHNMAVCSLILGLGLVVIGASVAGMLRWRDRAGAVG